MQGIEFSMPDGEPDAATAAAIQQATTRQQLLTLTSGPAGNVVRLVPPLVATEDEIALVLERFEAVVAAAVVGTAAFGVPA